MKRSEVVRILREHRDVLIDSYSVKSLMLFGSVARDAAQPGSDVDLLVEFDRQVGLFEFIGLKLYLEKILGWKVDLGTPRSLKPHLKEGILQDAIPSLIAQLEDILGRGS